MRKCFYLAAAWLLACSFTTIHLMGDSTCADKDIKGGANPERGWGMMFRNFVDNQYKVVNYAMNGRSTKSFIDEGRWDKVKDNLKEGDYVFIQFGHNDSKTTDSLRFAAPWGAYQDNLRRFIREAREKGAKPVLLTPVARRWFKKGRLDRNCHTDYPAAMKQVALQEDVPLLDITASSLDWLERLGDEGSKPYFMISTGKNDNTHTVACGARAVSLLVCDAIREQLPDIAQHLVYQDIFVDQNGFGDYMTVQEAIDAAPDYSHKEITTIHINAGTYKECIRIPHSKFRLKITGDGAENTILTYDKYARAKWPGREFEVGTSGSASIYIHASYITFEDLAFENSAGEGKEIAQAVAVFTDGDFLFFGYFLCLRDLFRCRDFLCFGYVFDRGSLGNSRFLYSRFLYNRLPGIFNLIHDHCLVRLLTCHPLKQLIQILFCGTHMHLPGYKNLHYHPI